MYNNYHMKKMNTLKDRPLQCVIRIAEHTCDIFSFNCLYVTIRQLDTYRAGNYNFLQRF